MKLDILAFAAHPDDVELACSGTLLHHLANGYKVGIIDLTRGEMGTRGSADLRDEESAASSKILGITVRENLKMQDGFFLNDKTHQMPIVQYIRKYQPSIVLCNAVSDRHPDHGRAGALVSQACFLSGLPKVETMMNGVEQNAHRPQAVYHYIQDRYIKPDFVIDISAHMERKMECILAYKSQFYHPDNSEPETPISGKEFLEFVQARATEMGRSINVKYAEGFTVERIPAVRTFFDLI